MDQQTELLRAVIHQPDLDIPRRAYGDWCALQSEEELRARGEFIRLTFEIQEAPLADLNAGKKYIQQYRMGELVERWGSAWARPLAPYVDGYEFYRGFVSLVKMKASNFLRHAGDVFERAPIRHLDLTDVREVADELFRSEHLERIYSLSMNSCGLTSPEMRLLTASTKLSSLRWLSLENNALDYEASRVLAGARHLTRLRTIMMRGNPVDPTEELGFEGGYVIDTNLPEAGERLEKEFGRVPWLYWNPDQSRYSD